MPTPATAPPRHKPTKGETMARVREIVGLLYDGRSRAYVVQYAAKKWGIRSRQADNLLARAAEAITAATQRRAATLLNLHIAMRHRLYASAVAKGDERAALAVLDSVAKLLGLYPRPGDNRRMSDEELNTALAQLADAPAVAPGGPPPAPAPEGRPKPRPARPTR